MRRFLHYINLLNISTLGTNTKIPWRILLCRFSPIFLVFLFSFQNLGAQSITDSKFSTSNDISSNPLTGKFQQENISYSWLKYFQETSRDFETKGIVVCTSVSSGPWSNPSTWSCGAVPSAGDNVVIALGTTVTVD